MRTYRYTILCLALLFLSVCASVKAQIRMPDIFSDNCVLQHNSKVNIWGWADANNAVSVKASWNGETQTVKSDAEGRWTAQLATPDASNSSYTITVSQEGDTQYTINNVAIGDVWFCSGQSNMEMPVKGWLPECPIEHSESMIQQSGDYTQRVRCTMIQRSRALSPRSTCLGKWEPASPAATPHFSAVAYSFAMHLASRVNHPVGIIVSAWGGSYIEQWLPKRSAKKMGVKADAGNAWAWPNPSLLYNAMVYPLKDYTCAGFLWYQGENNVGDSHYAEKQKELIASWRSEWKEPKAPFYMVEIAPYNYSNDSAPDLRAQQLGAALETEHCGLVCTNDLVTDIEAARNIHPGNKLEIGYRLVDFAHKPEWKDPWSPVYKSMQADGDKAIISFSHNEQGFLLNPDITGFEVAGPDKVFHHADAEIVNKKQVRVCSPMVKKIVAVRYCWGNTIIGNLKNRMGLPVFAFRTDNW